MCAGQSDMHSRIVLVRTTMSKLMSAQPRLFTHEELEYHNPSLPGFFSVLAQASDGEKYQRSHKLVDMPRVIALLDKTRDTWLTQAEFMRPNRRAVNLWRLPLLFCDIDTYTVKDLAGVTPERLVQALLYHCKMEGIPEPSLIVFSGRGLQAKWLLNQPLPRAALPRWNLCQIAIVDALKPMGADPNAKDVSRVLRLVGAVNTKSGEVARVVHVNEDANGEPVRYNFEYLAETLLPVMREKIEQQRKKWAAEKDAKQAKKQQLVLLPGGRKTDGLKRFAGRQLSWHRLEDLRKLAEIRGGIKEGQRMSNLFWQLNFLLLSGATNSVQMWHEAVALARAIDPSWHYDKSALSTLYAKAKQFGAGEKIEFQGKQYPALYTPKNDRLIQVFEITDDEQRQMQTIITPELARERDAERKKAKRAAAGAMTREEYESQSKSKLKPWEAEGVSRRTWYRRRSVDNS